MWELAAICGIRQRKLKRAEFEKQALKNEDTKDEAKSASVENGFRMIMDSGSTMTIIPYF